VETPKSIVTLPAGTTTIEAEAFRNTDAEYVIVPDGCKTIGSKAFANMSSLKYVQLPASIESIADDAFDGCAIVEIITAAE